MMTRIPTGPKTAREFLAHFLAHPSRVDDLPPIQIFYDQLMKALGVLMADSRQSESRMADLAAKAQEKIETLSWSWSAPLQSALVALQAAQDLKRLWQAYFEAEKQATARTRDRSDKCAKEALAALKMMAIVFVRDAANARDTAELLGRGRRMNGEPTVSA